MARRIKGEIKRRKTDPASNQFLKCSPPSGTHRDSQSWVEKRRGREEIEATWWRSRRFVPINNDHEVINSEGKGGCR